MVSIETKVLGMALLDEPGVLDALSGSPSLSLLSKRVLAQVNSCTKDAVWKIFRGNLIHVHPSDCTVANADFLVHVLLCDTFCNGNPDVVLNVVGENMTRHVKLALLPNDISEPYNVAYELAGTEGVVEHTTAYFLGHIFAQHAYCDVDVYVQLTTGVINLRAMQRYVFYDNPPHENRPWWLEWSALDRALMSGTLLRNAERRTTKGVIHHDHGKLELNRLRLDDDQMCTIGPRIRAQGKLIRELNMCGNYFGMHGTAALLREPQPPHGRRSWPDPEKFPFSIAPRWPVLEKLFFSNTPMGAAGYASLCYAISTKQMPNLKCMHLCNTGLGDVGARLLFETLPSAPKLEKLSLDMNPIGRCGLAPLKRLPPRQIVLPSLKKLNVRLWEHNEKKIMRASGWRVLAQAILDNCFPKMESICIVNSSATVCVELAVVAVLKRREAFAAENDAKQAIRD